MIRLAGDARYQIRSLGFLELDFDVLLVAHGVPVVGDAKDALRRFSASG